MILLRLKYNTANSDAFQLFNLTQDDLRIYLWVICKSEQVVSKTKKRVKEQNAKDL